MIVFSIKLQHNHIFVNFQIRIIIKKKKSFFFLSERWLCSLQCLEWIKQHPLSTKNSGKCFLSHTHKNRHKMGPNNDVIPNINLCGMWASHYTFCLFVFKSLLYVKAHRTPHRWFLLLFLWALCACSRVSRAVGRRRRLQERCFMWCTGPDSCESSLQDKKKSPG